MFYDPGRKIKLWAVVLFVINLVLSIVTALYHFYTHKELAGLLILILGAVFSYVFSLFIYGFGQLVDKTQSMESIMTENKNTLHKIMLANNASTNNGDKKSFETEEPLQKKCSYCGTLQHVKRSVCWKCGKDF